MHDAQLAEQVESGRAQWVDGPEQFGPEQFHRIPDEYKELVVHQMMAHTEGELSGADDYLELFYPMTDDPYEKKVCCERGGEEVDHYRKGAKVLADIGQDAAFMLDIPLQERSLYATEAVKRINDWPERGFFSMLGEAAVFDILKEMAESSYSQAVYSWLLVSAGRFLRTPAFAEAWIDLAEGYWKQFVWSPFK